MKRRTTLRTRLLAVLVILLALVCAGVGTVTVVALRGFLVDRLDDQLAAAGGRSANAGGPPRDGGQQPTGAQFLLAPGQAAGTLGARIRNGTIDAAAVLDDDGEAQEVPSADVTALTAVPTDGRPHTVTVEPGSFRVLASRLDSGDVLVTGLPLREVDRTVNRLIAVELAVAGGALLLTTALGALIVRRALRPLRRVAGTARRVSTLPLAQGEVALPDRIDAADVDDRTEVGQVAGAVNRLLDHVASALTARHESETKVRRFVADASHELRTPLTAIRGYAELTRGSRADLPPDVAHALNRVESEAGRMSVMVADLLLLARLDAGRELAREPVDLTHLLLDVISDATASAPDHRYRVQLPDDPVTVIGDADGLHQVFANLLGNARVHTPAGSTVTTTLSSSSPDTVAVTVLDDGPGIPADLLPVIFERFARGAASRSRAAGSTGLGLAIVHAIVAAHHGEVKVSSRPGQTAFVVRLPIRPVRPEGS